MSKRGSAARRASVGLALLFALPASALATRDRGAGAGAAAPVTYMAFLTGAHEVPPSRYTCKSEGCGNIRRPVGAVGQAIVVLSTDETSITVDLSFSLDNIGEAVTAEIHKAANGVNGPAVFHLTRVPTRCGRCTVPKQSFAISPAQVAALKAGLYYIDVHSTRFRAGAIRGQLREPTPIQVEGREFSFTLSATSVADDGWVRFGFTNVGQVPHGFKIGGKSTPTIQPGETATLLVLLRKGRYLYSCTVVGHAAVGMRGSLQVR
jgi:plastocyanin